MAFIQVSSAPSRDAYMAVEKVLDLAGNRPTGMVLHAASETGDGSVLIVDVWESDAAMDAFERQRLFPALETGGQAAAMQAPPIRHHAFALVRG